MRNKNNKIENNENNDAEIEKKESNKKTIYKYNILFVGEPGIGTKTSLIQRLIQGKFFKIEEGHKEKCGHLVFESGDKEILLYLIDTSGDEEKLDLYKIYYKNADCVILGYDVTDKDSFQEVIDYWYDEIKQLCNTNLIYLLGNKIDLDNKIQVRDEEAKSFADKNKIKFYSMSVEYNVYVQNFIDDLKRVFAKGINNKINIGINEILYGNPSKDVYQVVLLGESGIGSKTSLLNAIINKSFDYHCRSTSTATYASKQILLKNGNKLIIKFCDTPGQEKFRALTQLFMKDVDCVILGYDITAKSSFESIKTYWYKTSKEISGTDLIYLLGNKIDILTREVPEDEARNYAKENNIRYFEISCLSYLGIIELMEDLVGQLIRR